MSIPCVLCYGPISNLVYLCRDCLNFVYYDQSYLDLFNQYKDPSHNSKYRQLYIDTGLEIYEQKLAIDPEKYRHKFSLWVRNVIDSNNSIVNRTNIINWMIKLDDPSIFPFIVKVERHVVARLVDEYESKRCFSQARFCNIVSSDILWSVLLVKNKKINFIGSFDSAFDHLRFNYCRKYHDEGNLPYIPYKLDMYNNIINIRIRVFVRHLRHPVGTFIGDILFDLLRL